MKRETRLNLLFLVAFLAITLPGAVILFKKKLDPNATRLFLPDAIRHQIAYMAPIPDVAETRRVVPPLTHGWIARLIAERAPDSRPILPVGREGTFPPAISDDKRAEVVAVTQVESKSVIYLVLWGPTPDAGPLTITLVGDKPVPATVEQREDVPVPGAVRAELREFSYSSPPASVRWLRVSLPVPLSDGQSVSLQLTSGPGDGATTNVNFFTSIADQNAK